MDTNTQNDCVRSIIDATMTLDVEGVTNMVPDAASRASDRLLNALRTSNDVLCAERYLDEAEGIAVEAPELADTINTAVATARHYLFLVESTRR